MARAGLGAGVMAAWSFLLLAGCAGVGYQPTPPGPGVPVISALRFEPTSVKAGQEVILSFTFADSEADIVEARLIERGVIDFQFFTGLNPVVVDLRKHLGEATGRVSIPLRWRAPGYRLYEVYVVDEKGNVSNPLRGSIAVE